MRTAITGLSPRLDSIQRGRAAFSAFAEDLKRLLREDLTRDELAEVNRVLGKATAVLEDLVRQAWRKGDA